MNEWSRGGARRGGLLRGIVDALGRMDSLAVVVVTGIAMSLVAFMAIQWVSRSESSHPEEMPFQSPEREASRSESRGKTAAASSSLDFAPRMVGGAAEPPKEASSQPGVEAPPAAPAAGAGAPTAPSAPAVPPAATAVLDRQRVAGGGSASAGGGFAAGARVGGTPEEAKAAGAIGSEPFARAGAAAGSGGSEIVRQLIPIIREFQKGTILQQYRSGTVQRNYAVEQFGQAVAEKNLFINPNAIVTTKDAEALAEGLGIHLPKGKDAKTSTNQIRN